MGEAAVDGRRRQDEGVQKDGSYSSSCIWMIKNQKLASTLEEKLAPIILRRINERTASQAI